MGILNFIYKRQVRKWWDLYVKSDFKNLSEFINYYETGIVDGWINVNNMEYKSLLYLKKLVNNG